MGIIDNRSGQDDRKRGCAGLRRRKRTKRSQAPYRDRHTRQSAGIDHSQRRHMQDRDGGPGVIRQACDSFPTLACMLADAGYSGDKLQTAVEAFDGPKIEIVKRPQGVTGFVVVTRRWVVERTFAWLGRCRRLARTGTSIASTQAWTLIAAIRRSMRYVARQTADE